MDLTVLTDAELDQLRRDVLTEQENRSLRERAVELADTLTRQVLAAEGAVMEGPWQQTRLGYPTDWVVTHNGHRFESLVDGNVWEPDVGPLAYQLWRDLDNLPTGNEWDPNGHDYHVGDVCTFNGKTFTARQDHTSQPGWTPELTPALWEETTP